MGSFSIWHWLIVVGALMLFVWFMINQAASNEEDIGIGLAALAARREAEAEADALAEAKRLEDERLAALARLEAERKAAEKAGKAKFLILAKRKTTLDEEITSFEKQLAFFREQDPDDVSDSEYARANKMHKQFVAKQKEREIVTAELVLMNVERGA